MSGQHDSETVQALALQIESRIISPLLALRIAVSEERVRCLALCQGALKEAFKEEEATQ